MALTDSIEFFKLKDTKTVVDILEDLVKKLNSQHKIPQEHNLCEITMESDETRAVIRLEPTTKSHKTNYKIGNIGHIVKLIERIYSTTEYKNSIAILTDPNKQRIYVEYKTAPAEI